ncbi:MAG: L-histidine N(alpha)-methyltransferase [Desulfobulbaceae bacterium]|nr:L-histidine N(alpha)-methyltransferase [Desulfobulbaceae bacterium]
MPNMKHGGNVQYEAYSNFDSLQTTFDTALQDQLNIVLQARSLSDQVSDFAQSVCAGLEQRPRRLDCRFLYDARGSELYEHICSQPEYYLTRTEAGILRQFADEICLQTGSCHLIELGSGSSVKTDYLLSAYQSHYGNICYTPIDISAAALKLAGRDIISKRPEVQFVAIHGTYSDSFQIFRCASPALVIFLGSTLGNFHEDEEHAFWQDISQHMEIGDFFLLGVDLVKEAGILEAAYNDAAGITAAFTGNYFARMNRELGTSLDLNHIRHVAFYNHEKSRVEIYAEFTEAQKIHIRSRHRTFTLAQGETVQLEISRKFHLPAVRENLISYGFEQVKTYTDAEKWFGLLLFRKTR